MQNLQKQFILALLAYAGQREADLEQVCKQSGLNHKALLTDTQTAISNQQVEQLWKNLSHQCHDPLFGLHFGESMQLAALGVVGQVILTSSTVGEALTNAGTLIGLLTDLFSLQLEHGPQQFTLHLIADPKKQESIPFTYRHLAEYLMVFTVHELDGLLLQRIRPVSVQMPYAISEPSKYARVFRCPVQPRQPGFSLAFSNTYLNQPIISANYALQNHLLQQINGLVKEAKEEGPLQTRIFNYLLTNSYLYAMSLEAVAANFNVSPRTLQRKLKEEGVSFLQIVDEVRQKLAVHYLTSGNYQIKEVSYILGYNEQSAFIRAFKRWTGKTPTDFLNQADSKATQARS
ncbi:AraC family transcriptional regulator [Nibrella saemangeumensis]|uniref:AraC family transcriptional regulator n=1 Tax=Nibrella saemangeumensis TaxID=1084526 RepID=A0ABP8MGY9_9BACT